MDVASPLLSSQQILVQGLRNAVPYIREHDGKVFVLAFGGEALDAPERFSQVVRDVVLLADLGLVLCWFPARVPKSIGA